MKTTAGVSDATTSGAKAPADMTEDELVRRLRKLDQNPKRWRGGTNAWKEAQAIVKALVAIGAAAADARAAKPAR